MEFRFWFIVGLFLLMLLMIGAGSSTSGGSILVFCTLGSIVAVLLMTYVFWVVKGLSRKIYKLLDQVRDLQKDK